MSIRIARIRDEALSIQEHLDAVDDATAGAVATFIGRVRDHDPEASTDVVALEYTGHPDAEKTLAGIAQKAIDEAGGDAIVAVSHRIGKLGVGDLAVVIAVASSHRDEAFTVCRDVIETIKRELPIWKRQFESDGTGAWKGIGG
ncbi:molybdenum cofactor biosynthesis protein MoaE [Microbacterium pseudoresistens]|uniref:Molybdopterin synthase catalytic subunit n=1 Tax=Microbacterium pseudoresistens TaxID=640634 RepID=A0A7Y9ETD3_9MICO|nr:molybdenum cofactor biosynthesis protein MoaE [Microbacterium pseudoresistens]NYD53608.1 molybdopterin synthase catalytic subunit [Microbacterium pseudoresistens]